MCFLPLRLQQIYEVQNYDPFKGSLALRGILQNIQQSVSPQIVLPHLKKCKIRHQGRKKCHPVQSLAELMVVRSLPELHAQPRCLSHLLWISLLTSLTSRSLKAYKKSRVQYSTAEYTDLAVGDGPDGLCKAPSSHGMDFVKDTLMYYLLLDSHRRILELQMFSDVKSEYFRVIAEKQGVLFF